MIEAIIKYEFLQNAIIASILAGIICSVIGVIISQKNLILMSGGIAHTAYGGVGLGFLLGFEPIIGAGIFAVFAAIIIGFVNRKTTTNTNVTISLLWSLGMASGVVFTALMPGYPPDMNSYLFGNILSVTKQDICLMLILSAVILLCVIIFWQDWKAFLFDAEFAKIIGINTAFLEYLLLILTALCIVVLIRSVGIILVIALFCAPAAIAAILSKNLKNRIIMATALCTLFCLLGLIISYNLGIPSGAAIVFIAVISYFVCLIIKKICCKN